MFDPLFWSLAVLAVLIVALSKAGLLGSLGMVAVPLMTFVMPAREAAGMLPPLLLVMDAIAIWTYRKDADWNILRIMLPGAMIGTLVGWVLWSLVSDAMVLLFVGVVTLLFILDAILPLRRKLEGLPPSKPWGAFWGGFAGFTSFISHYRRPALPDLPASCRSGSPVRYSHQRLLLRHRQHRQVDPLTSSSASSRSRTDHRRDPRRSPR